MSNSFLEGAYLLILNFHGHECTLERKSGSDLIQIKLANANRHRNLDAFADITYEGETFVVSKKHLDDQAFGTPKKGDLIISPIYGSQTIADVKPDVVAGNIIGYRLGCS